MVVPAPVQHQIAQKAPLVAYVPARLAIGSAVLTLFVVLTIAGGNDVLAVFLHVGVEELTQTLRILAFVAPLVVAAIAYRLATERRRRDAEEEP